MEPLNETSEAISDAKKEYLKRLEALMKWQEESKPKPGLLGNLAIWIGLILSIYIITFTILPLDYRWLGIPISAAFMAFGFYFTRWLNK